MAMLQQHYNITENINCLQLFYHPKAIFIIIWAYIFKSIFIYLLNRKIVVTM